MTNPKRKEIIKAHIKKIRPLKVHKKYLNHIFHVKTTAPLELQIMIDCMAAAGNTSRSQIVKDLLISAIRDELDMPSFMQNYQYSDFNMQSEIIREIDQEKK